MVLNEEHIYTIAFGCIGATAGVLKFFENYLSKRMFFALFFFVFSIEIAVFLYLLDVIDYTTQYGLRLGPIGSIVFITIGFLYIALTTLISIPAIINLKMINICPSIFFLSYMDRFASNGKSDYRFLKVDGSDCIKICLRNYYHSAEGNQYYTTFGDCGVIFEKNLNYPYLSKGFKISDKKFMEIQIKGAKGGERVGVAIKNTDGEEMKVGFDKLLQGGITNAWNVVRVDLRENFQYVVISQGRDKYMENISIFTNTNMVRWPEEQIVFIRRISFIK